jgi:hypothetical protein
MTSAQETAAVCSNCGVEVEICACGEEQCDATICASCLRIRLGESLAHPHAHGG